MSDWDKLTTAQRVKFQMLCESVSEYSEQSYCAGWLDGVEFTLLQWLIDLKSGRYKEQGRFGMLNRMSSQELLELERLSTESGGYWPVWQDSGSDWFEEGGAGPVPLDIQVAYDEKKAYDDKWAKWGFSPDEF